VREAWARRGPTAHPGLAFSKYADTWEPSWLADGPRKKEFFEKVVALVEAQRDGRRLYPSFLARRQALFETLSASGSTIVGRGSPLKSSWRSVSGLGIAHPFESGFVWDWTYGVPYLPGSSIKGAARAWAMQCLAAHDLVVAIFGPDVSAGSLRKGDVIFFDAYPADPRLQVDILNPHYKRYYEGDEPPGDWLSPEPAYFLTLAPGQSFEFVVGVSQGIKSFPAGMKDAAELAAKAWDAVVGAAQEFGMGGKTAVGYGYFEQTR
jgi:CRISPR-associated protein Cmr6